MKRDFAVPGDQALPLRRQLTTALDFRKLERSGWLRRSGSGTRPPPEVTVPPASVEDVGFSLVVLSLVFACAALIRRWTRPLRRLFIPTAVIGGFLVLGLGPEGMGRLLGGAGIFPEHVFAVWRQLPSLLVTAMSASLLLGEHLPPFKTL